MGNSSSSVTGGGAVFCGQCGHNNLANFNFCQKCGEASGASKHSGVRAVESKSSMTLLKATAMYAASLGLSVLAFWLDPRVGSPLYLVFGFVMTRFVMGGLIQWHPNYNTVHNVFTAKFKMFLLWPLQMPLLLVKLIFNSVM